MRKSKIYSRSILRILFIASLQLQLVSCGGGDGTRQPDLDVTVTALLISKGTILTCNSPVEKDLVIYRKNGNSNIPLIISCPGQKLLPDDFRPSQWIFRSSINAQEITVATQLPEVILLQDGVQRLVFISPLPDGVLEEMGAMLEATKTNQSTVVSEKFSNVVTTNSAQDRDLNWRVVATIENERYASPNIPPRKFIENDLGYWGAASISRIDETGQAYLLGQLTKTNSGNGYQEVGLSKLVEPNRDFRDVVVADLTGRGSADVVNNVYGVGCTIFAMEIFSNAYSFQTPTRKDGSCVGGSGETLLVADFDGDGLSDIFLPSYQRFDLFLNRGAGKFESVADERNISYPNYRPQVEGAAAVDLDGNGTIDIVIGNEILLNDGTGHFKPLGKPFGQQPVFDEGMLVADIDGDGTFDIVKNDPQKGPRVFWGVPGKLTFEDGGWLWGGKEVLVQSFGITAADFFGHGRKDLVISGGAQKGQAPIYCLQISKRRFDCLFEFFTSRPDRKSQDLLLAEDLNGDGSPDLVSRYGTLFTYINPIRPKYTYSLDIRDKNGVANRFGRVVKVFCQLNGQIISTSIIDGGNGYMSHGAYPISISSDWCKNINVKLESSAGLIDIGDFGPGRHVIRSPR